MLLTQCQVKKPNSVSPGVQKQEVGPDADRLVNREEKQWGRDVRPNHQSSIHRLCATATQAPGIPPFWGYSA